MNQTKQVFNKDSESSSKKVTWSTRFILFFILLLLAALLLMMKFDKTPKIPFKQDYQSVITANKPFLQENRLSKEYTCFIKFIAQKQARDDNDKQISENAFYNKYSHN